MNIFAPRHILAIVP